MDTRMKELIAIGAAATGNCVACLRYHLAKAREAGATEADIRAAVGVGRLVRKGAAGAWDKEAASMLGAAEPASGESAPEPAD